MREGSNNVSRGLTNSCYWLVSMALGAMTDSAGSWNICLSSLAWLKQRSTPTFLHWNSIFLHLSSLASHVVFVRWVNAASGGFGSHCMWGSAPFSLGWQLDSGRFSKAQGRTMGFVSSVVCNSPDQSAVFVSFGVISLVSEGRVWMQQFLPDVSHFPAHKNGEPSLPGWTYGKSERKRKTASGPETFVAAKTLNSSPFC